MGDAVVNPIRLFMRKRYVAVSLIAAECVLISMTVAVADDRPSLPSRIPLSVHLTAVFGVVAGCAILIGAFYFLRAIFRFVWSQRGRASASPWHMTFSAREYSQEGRLLFAGSLKDLGRCGWMLVLAVGAIVGLNRQ